MSDKDKAKDIRDRLKNELGLNRNHVGVRLSGGSAINVKLKSVEAVKNRDKIEAIAKEHESIDRCEMTGEILSGGNTFVFFKVDNETKAELTEPYLDAAFKAFEESNKYIGRNAGVTADVEETDVTFYRENETTVTAFVDGVHAGRFWVNPFTINNGTEEQRKYAIRPIALCIAASILKLDVYNS